MVHNTRNLIVVYSFYENMRQQGKAFAKIFNVFGFQNLIHMLFYRFVLLHPVYMGISVHTVHADRFQSFSCLLKCRTYSICIRFEQGLFSIQVMSKQCLEIFPETIVSSIYHICMIMCIHIIHLHLSMIMQPNRTTSRLTIHHAETISQLHFAVDAEIPVENHLLSFFHTLFNHIVVACTYTQFHIADFKPV